MSTFDLQAFTGINEADVTRFRRDGFLVLERVLSEDRIVALRESFPKLFAGRFDTGVYPDEWYWREGMSLPDVTRHIANAWKADLTIAKLVLSEDLGKAAARLTGWSSVRLGQDTIWWKAPKTKSIAYHQDSSFMDFLNPALTVTCWVTLDDTSREAGTLEYVPGSHLWPLTPLPEAFHGEKDYRSQMKVAAEAVGIIPPDPIFIEVPAGSCVFHAGEIWHGSGPNTTGDRMRRSIGIHMIPGDAEFSERHGGYIYKRYQRTGDPKLEESFFPLLASDVGERTGWLEHYCCSGRR
ncbi:phytanoyl-CoA dioxygenase family protein [Filomicrobium sp.]|uniref:phytanoyl-CoA dioxygenase family protein n=1 Tax=Filomicrobium sp. TaxID=2024831 RepID=UPI002587131B|nr:phytanoyl-CoA dioxygenase family protein [Filomicrobium sp.]MCV0370203.1 phytanoyl-CoA dioxygenase family protein [Filomicrobium sp.]